jgi:serine protease Do
MAPFYSDPFFRQFFGDDFSGQFRVPREQRERSLGSGVIISPEGHILTNNHVVEGATEIKISLADKRELKANVVGTDSRTDIAVLKIDAKDLPVVTFADSSNVQVGEFVLAVGNPFGVGQTVTMGIVSATGRGGLGIEDYEDFIQTDAAINPGNSGGAMINVHGGLIGINTAIISGAGGGNQGVGFAVPVNMAREVMDHIIKHGRVIRGWLGVVVQPLTPAVAKAFALPGQPRGALISDVAPDSPASRSGLAKGDIILLLNGDPVTDSRTLSLKISMLAPGTTIRLKTFREGRERDVSVTLSELPVKAARTGQTGIPSSGFELGISVQPLTAQAARQLGLPTQTQGVLVDDIEPGSQAGDAGIRRGDVIQEVNHKPVTSPDEFQRLINQSRNQTILFLINRGGDHLFIAIEPR